MLIKCKTFHGFFVLGRYLICDFVATDIHKDVQRTKLLDGDQCVIFKICHTSTSDFCALFLFSLLEAFLT